MLQINVDMKCIAYILILEVNIHQMTLFHFLKIWLLKSNSEHRYATTIRCGEMQKSKYQEYDT